VRRPRFPQTHWAPARRSSVRPRETNPEWIEAWRALYGYPHRDASAEHVRDAFSAKQRVMLEKGTNYPAWILDQAGIEFVLVLDLGNRTPAGTVSPVC